MRPMRLIVVAAGILLFNLMKKDRDRDEVAPRQNEAVGKPTAEQLVGFLRLQSESISSVETKDLYTQVRFQGSSYSLERGNLLCQKPRSMKLVGKKVALGEQVVAGSNDERFWFWVKQDPSNALFHCSYTDFDRGADLPFPFQPDWVLDAFGMSAPGPVGNYRFEEDAKYYRLIESATLRGQPVTKEILFHKGWATNEQPQVVGRTITDANNKVLFRATTKSVQRFQGKWAVPREIVFEWPQQDAKMEFDLGRLVVNPQLSPDDFVMPRLGSRQIDLGRDHPTGRGVIPAGR
jgi:hypothetical protein